MIEKPEYYKLIGEVSKINSWKEKVLSLSQKDWNSFLDRKVFPDQKDSNTIPIYNLPDEQNNVFNIRIENEKMLSLFKDELQECYSLIDTVYINHEPKRVMLVNLPARKNVETHIDSAYHLENIHRIHLPIITNDDVVFKVSNNIVPMRSGSLIEINNNVEHGVENNSDMNRIHLIIDYGNKNDDYWN